MKKNQSNRLLDLYCGAGGCSDGYSQAGFTDITGVDYVPQANYPVSYKFKLSRCIFALKDHDFLNSFKLVHASPPCYAFLDSTGSALSYPDYLAETRFHLQESGVPYIIENVPEAPLDDPKIIICGASHIFAGELRVIRHRTFEFSKHFLDTDGECLVPEVFCPPKHPRIHTLKRAYKHFGETDEFTDFVTVTGGGNCTKLAALDAMGYKPPFYPVQTERSFRMIKSELNQSIPPAYTRYLGKYALDILA